VLGVRLTWRRTLVLAVLGAATLAMLAGLDYARPEERQTHLGRFVGTVVRGDAWPVLQRKLELNLRLLTRTASALVPAGAGALLLGVLARRPTSSTAQAPLAAAASKSPALRPLMLAVVVMLAIAFVLNDSGVVIPAVAAMLAVPLLVAECARAVAE
jgi:hypothetical protein